MTTPEAGHGHSNAANVACIIVAEPRGEMVPAGETEEGLDGWTNG